MTVQRRDGEGNVEIGPTWESLVERQIREAIDGGAFDGLPHRGRRLPLDDVSAAGERALGFHVLRNAGIAPPWIEADKEVRAQLEKRDELLARAPRTALLGRRRLREDLRRTVEAANRAIARLNAEAPSDRLHRRPVDLEVELAALETAFDVPRAV